jgi:hypothetical protein
MFRGEFRIESELARKGLKLLLGLQFMINTPIFLRYEYGFRSTHSTNMGQLKTHYPRFSKRPQTLGQARDCSQGSSLVMA